MSAREREVRACGRTLPHLKHLTLQGRIAYQCPGIQMASESTTPLSEQQLAEIAVRVAAAEGGWHVVSDEIDPHRFEIHGDGPTHVAVFGGNSDDGFASYPVRENAEFAAHAREDVPALLAEVGRLRARVDEMVHVAMGDRKVRVFDEVGEVRNARTIADAQLARANTLDRLCREKNEHVAALEAERADREDDLAAALGRSGLDWTDLIDVATTAMRRAEGLDATDAAEVDRLTARVSVLEAERHTTNEALDTAVKAQHTGRKAVIEEAAAWLAEVGQKDAAYLLRTCDIEAGESA
jgi:hypothetical protein